MKKSKQIKRTLTLIIAIVLCFTVAIIPASAADYYDIGEYDATLDEVNESLDCKVTNGGFETGTIHGWSTIFTGNDTQKSLWENAISVTSAEKHSGNYAGMVAKAADDEYYGYQTLVYKPKFDTNYTLTYWAKTTGTAKVGSAFLAQGDESTNWETFDQHWMNSDEYFISAGDWEKREYTFSVPNNEDIKILSIRLMVYGEGTAYIDDVSLTEVSDEEAQNRFNNGDFNNGSNAWSIGMSTEIPPEPTVVDCGFTNGDFENTFASDSSFAYNINDAVAEFTTTNVHSGTYAVKYTSGYFTNYGTSVEPGTYKLSMWVNIVSGDTAEISGFVSGCGIPWQDFAMTAVRGVTNGWVKTSGEITFTEAGTPQFGFKSYDGSGEVYIDDITLTKEYIEPLKTKTEILGNNNFTEDDPNGGTGLLGWARSSNIEIVNDNGTNAVKMTCDGGSTYIQQRINVVPGKTYELSYDLKTQEQDGNDAQCQVFIQDPDFHYVTSSEYKTYGWKHISVEYTVPDGVTAIDVGFQHNVVAGVSFWKNLSFSYYEDLTEEVRGESIITNGSFENDTSGWNVTNTGAATSGIDTANASDGSKSLKMQLQNGSDQVYAEGTYTSAEPSTTYELSYDLKIVPNPAGGNSAQCIPVLHDFGDGRNPLSNTLTVIAKYNTANGDFEKVTYRYTTSADTNAIRLDLMHNGVAGTSYWDNVKFEKVSVETVYPQSTFSEGVGVFGKDSNVSLKVDTTTEFWNYGTTVTAGKKYVYTMDVKIEDSEDGFMFYPYVMNFGDSWQQETVYYGDTNWTRYEFVFTAATPDATNGTRFGFVRNGVGTVYIDNVCLRLASDIAAAGGLKDTNLATDTMIGIDADDEAVQTISGIEEGKEYTLKFNVVSWEDDEALVSAMLGDAGFDSLGVVQNDSYIGITATITALQSGDVDLVFGSLDAASVISDVELCRVYSFGDVNGDDSINILDLVKFKKYLADNDNGLATYVYADIEIDGVLNSLDLAGLVDIIIAG